MTTRISMDRGLARIVGQIAGAIRSALAEDNFTEIFVPHLTSIKERPFISTFKVSAPNLGFEGALRVSANLFIVTALSELERVYTFSSSFRAESSPTTLIEFQAGELGYKGNFESALRLSERIMSSAVASLLSNSSPLPLAQARQLERIQFPLARVTYDEAVQAVGEPENGFSQEQRLLLTRNLDSRPVFVTHFPVDFKPCFGDMKEEEQRLLGFELWCPNAGEVMMGGELETNLEVLLNRVDSFRIFREAIQMGLTEEQVKSYLRAIGQLESPHIRLAFGLERLTQFLTGAQEIEEATLFPVTARRNQPSGFIIWIDRIIIIGPVPEPEPV